MRTKILLLVIFTVVQVTSADSQIIEWQNTIGGNDNDLLYSTEPTQDGGYILGGHSLSPISGDKTEAHKGNGDYWVVKTDAAGNLEWQNTIGGSSVDFLEMIHQTTDGGYICGGWSTSNTSLDKSESCIGGYDYWVIKLDSVGNIVWENTIGGTSNDLLRSIYQTSDGGYICGGGSSSIISGDKTEGNRGLDDYWIIKLDSAGVIEWQKTYGGNLNDHLRDIRQTADGGYICGGHSESDISFDKTEGSNGMSDYWVLKLDINGDIEWQNTIGGNGADELYSIQQTFDGGFICGGISSSGVSGDKTENSLGNIDWWVVKLDSAGTIEWQNTIGGSGNDQLNSISQTLDGGFIGGGFSASGISGDKTDFNRGNNDYWIVKLNEIGMVSWQKTLGGTMNDELTTMWENADGSFICGGFSASGISGEKTESTQGLYDYWIVKLTNHYNLIQGTVFTDLNSNNIPDSGDYPVPYKKITEINAGSIAFTDQNGFYSLVVTDTGSYQVMADLPNSYYSSVPSVHTATFSTVLQTDSLNDFAIQSNGVYNDLCVTITPTGFFRPNMMASYIITYSNQGTTTLNPVVVFYPDINVTYVSSNPTPSSVTNDSVVFTAGLLMPFETGQIVVTVLVAGVPIGTLINSGAAVLPIAGDANPACNYNSWEIFSTGSFDPNDILVNRATIFDFEMATPPFLEYIIRFQNTGNDTAFFVKIENAITNDLDIQSFEFISTSHSCNIQYQQSESIMNFIFYNILLPDSFANEPESHGFVRYRIRPVNSLTVGDSIRNYANIIFDYNVPVLTNTAITEIVDPTGLEMESDSHSGIIMVYPNPAEHRVRIELFNMRVHNVMIELFDMYGRKIKQFHTGVMNAGSWNGELDVSDLSNGMYMIKVNGPGIISKKIIKI